MRRSRTLMMAGLSALAMSAISLAAESRTIADLRDVREPTDGQQVEVSGYYVEVGPGAGTFRWDADCPRTKHNGGTIISPTVPWDGFPGASHLRFLDGIDESEPKRLGCWVRSARQTLRFTEWGGRGDWNGSTGTDNHPIWKRVRKHIGERGTTFILDAGYSNDYWFGDTVIVGRSNFELMIPPNVTARSTRPTSQGVLFMLGPSHFNERREPSAVKNVGVSGGGTIIVESQGKNENAIALSKVYGGWVRGMNLPNTNRKAITMQYDYQNIWVEGNRIGFTGHDAITVQGLYEATAGRPDAPHKDVYIVGNSIQSAARHGILAQRNAAASMSHIVVRGNTVMRAAGRGIAFNGVENVVHESNVVHEASVGAWFSKCSNVTGNVDVRNLRQFGLYLWQVTDYDFSQVFIQNAANGAIRDEERSKNAHIGHLRVTGTEPSLVYRAMSLEGPRFPLTIDCFTTDSRLPLSRLIRTRRAHEAPLIREHRQESACP